MHQFGRSKRALHSIGSFGRLRTRADVCRLQRTAEALLRVVLSRAASGCRVGRASSPCTWSARDRVAAGGDCARSTQHGTRGRICTPPWPTADSSHAAARYLWLASCQLRLCLRPECVCVCVSPRDNAPLRPMHSQRPLCTPRDAFAYEPGGSRSSATWSLPCCMLARSCSCSCSCSCPTARVRTRTRIPAPPRRPAARFRRVRLADSLAEWLCSSLVASAPHHILLRAQQRRHRRDSNDGRCLPGCLVRTQCAFIPVLSFPIRTTRTVEIKELAHVSALLPGLNAWPGLVCCIDGDGVGVIDQCPVTSGQEVWRRGQCARRTISQRLGTQ